MASFTATEVQQVRDFLGKPSVNTTVGSVSGPSASLAERLEALSEEAAASVRALLTKLATSRTDLEGARGRLKASKVGDIELNSKEISQRWREDYRFCQQLATVLDMQVVDHPKIPAGAGADVL